MKWNKKGHQFDDEFKKYDSLLGAKDYNIYFWGAGRYGKKCLNKLYSEFKVYSFIDNDEKKQGLEISGVPIRSFDEAGKMNGFIVITVLNEEIKNSIKAQLRNIGQIEGIDYVDWDFFYENIYPVVLLYKYNKAYVPVVELSLTERCTLKCKKCAHGCEYVPMDMEDLSLEEAKDSVDTLFRFADQIGNFYLIGGETLLYKQLDSIISYVGEKYRDKMENLMVSTNGTICPSKEVLTTAKRNKVLFNVSNYTRANPNLKEFREKVIKTISDSGCKLNLFEEEREWTDYGFDYVKRSGKEDELINVFDNCPTLCREIRGHKFYYCIQARAISENMKFNVGVEDYLDLSCLGDREEGKKEFFEYAYGYSEKGYLDMCNYCNGAENINHVIPAGEQLTK